LTDPASGGNTPLDEDEDEGLIPSHIATRDALNAWEQANIATAVEWLARRRRAMPILSVAFVRELHLRMFDETWRWAGIFRTTEKNIGVAPYRIAEELAKLLADVEYWLEHATYPLDEIAARLHHRLVGIHPFPNGNGRHARLLVDALLAERRARPFTWGSGDLAGTGELRARYLTALRRADTGDLSALLAFVRS
jgi:Fic-DOC domain mobile mystery protein B